ncbi:hypothetical protein [Granulicella tundricola]|uniref:Uncharacterized protein n=1 Tax=Granulicella tundricola (strain ATCC BAA-1859 / DSM 23138 / MP5ACTX9) TaxID=1198114 RepID=E8WZD6_GRATM|nr:hypothetical protein [Granulicella tundricola]ADW68824.1 hypothetical protein AciX9_1776 [Granulicella tundricola MP5ACTX9]
MKMHVAVSLSLLAVPLAIHAEQLVPAGSIIQCTVAEAKISSKTTNVGDPVLCQVSHVEMYGRSTFPYGSYLVGHFEDYKDPGHFVGKGWMELKFDRMVLQPDTVIPISARVVAAPKYNVDKEGRILGNGHPVRDIVEWSIPILWPIDLINLPRRGPSPVLKPESRLTLKLTDDLGIPTPDQIREETLPRRQAALIERQPAPEPVAYEPPRQQYVPQQTYAPQPTYQQQAPQVVYQINPPQPAPIIVQQQPAPQVVYQYPPPPPRYVPYGYYTPVPAAYRYYPPAY